MKLCTVKIADCNTLSPGRWAVVRKKALASQTLRTISEKLFTCWWLTVHPISAITLLLADTVRHLNMSRLPCQIDWNSEVPKQKCIAQQACFVVCRTFYIQFSTKKHSTAAFSSFALANLTTLVRTKVRPES